MAISLVAYGADSNPAGAHAFVGIPQPVGVKDGDVVLVAIAIPSAGVTASPPDSTWSQVAVTDPAQPLALSVWWTTALNLPVNLVFSLSSSVQATGVCAVYRGADAFQPVEAFSSALTAPAASHQVAAVTPSLGSEELALFVAGAASGTYTPASGYQLAVRKQQANATVELQHQPRQAAGTLAGFIETFSSAVFGASVTVVMAPSPGLSSYDDVYQRLLDGLPRGIDRLLDFTPGVGDFYKFFWSLGATLKLGFDLVDLLRQELLAHTSRYKLRDWERLFGLTRTVTATTGTVPQRQQQVLGSWRAAAAKSGSFATVAAAVGALLGYFPSTPVQFVEAGKAALRTDHTYGIGSDVVVPNGTTAYIYVTVPDGGVVSYMGAQLSLKLSTGSPWPMTATLLSPGGTSVTWTSTAGIGTGWTPQPALLRGQQFAGGPIRGTWVLSVTNNTGFSVTVQAAGTSLFVEGIARGQETGGAIFDWGAYADPAHLGESGTPADFAAARAVLKRMALSHTVANLLQSLVAYPNTDSGVTAAIPDECVPS